MIAYGNPVMGSDDPRMNKTMKRYNSATNTRVRYGLPIVASTY